MRRGRNSGTADTGGPRKSIVPVELQADPRLTDAARRVMLALGRYTNAKGECFRYVSNIAADTRLTTRSVHRAIALLKECGWLAVDARRGAGRCSVYRLMVPDQIGQLDLFAEAPKGAAKARTRTSRKGDRVVTSNVTQESRKYDSGVRSNVTPESGPILTVDLNDRDNEASAAGAAAAGAAGDTVSASPSPPPGEAVPDTRAILFAAGLDYLAAATGRAHHRLRPLLGKWLSRLGSDSAVLLDLISRAQRGRVADPISWIEARLRSPPETVELGPNVTLFRPKDTRHAAAHRKATILDALDRIDDEFD